MACKPSLKCNVANATRRLELDEIQCIPLNGMLFMVPYTPLTSVFACTVGYCSRNMKSDINGSGCGVKCVRAAHKWSTAHTVRHECCKRVSIFGLYIYRRTHCCMKHYRSQR